MSLNKDIFNISGLFSYAYCKKIPAKFMILTLKSKASLHCHKQVTFASNDRTFS